MTSVGVGGPAVLRVVVPGRLLRVVLAGRVRARRRALRRVEVAPCSRALGRRRRLAGLLGVIETAEPLRFLAGHPLTFRSTVPTWYGVPGLGGGHASQTPRVTA